MTDPLPHPESPLGRALPVMESGSRLYEVNPELARLLREKNHLHLLAALSVLGPEIVRRAQEIDASFEARYPDWPAILASLSERSDK